MPVCVYGSDRYKHINRAPVACMQYNLHCACDGHFTNSVVGRALGRLSAPRESEEERRRGFDGVPVEVPSDVA